VRTELAPLLDQAPQNEEGTGPVAGQNRCGAGGLQKMAPELSTPALRWRLPPGRGEVQEETALRLGIGFADGRNLETGKGRSGTKTQPPSTKRRYALYKKIFPTADEKTLADQTQVTAAVLG